MAKQTEWLIHIDEQGHATIDGQPVTLVEHTIILEITNPFTEIPVAIRKYTLQNEQQVLLAGAVFSLQQKQQEGIIKKSPQKRRMMLGWLNLRSLSLALIVSQKQPVRSDMIRLPVTMNLSLVQTEKSSIKGKMSTGDANCWTLTHGNQLKPFDLVVNKQDELGQALEGQNSG